MVLTASAALEEASVSSHSPSVQACRLANRRTAGRRRAREPDDGPGRGASQSDRARRPPHRPAPERPPRRGNRDDGRSTARVRRGQAGSGVLERNWPSSRSSSATSASGAASSCPTGNRSSRCDPPFQAGAEQLHAAVQVHAHRTLRQTGARGDLRARSCPRRGAGSASRGRRRGAPAPSRGRHVPDVIRRVWQPGPPAAPPSLRRAPEVVVSPGFGRLRPASPGMLPDLATNRVAASLSGTPPARGRPHPCEARARAGGRGPSARTSDRALRTPIGRPGVPQPPHPQALARSMNRPPVHFRRAGRKAERPPRSRSTDVHL